MKSTNLFMVYFLYGKSQGPVENSMCELHWDIALMQLQGSGFYYQAIKTWHKASKSVIRDQKDKLICKKCIIPKPTLNPLIYG